MIDYEEMELEKSKDDTTLMLLPQGKEEKEPKPIYISSDDDFQESTIRHVPKRVKLSDWMTSSSININFLMWLFYREV